MTKATGKKVERGPQIVDHIPDKPSPACRNTLSYSDAIDLLSRTRLAHHDEGVGITLEKGRDFGLK